MAISHGCSPEVHALLEALGLKGQNVTALDMRIRYNEGVTVTVTRFVDRSALGGLAEKVDQYRLVPVSEYSDDDKPATVGDVRRLIDRGLRYR